MDLNSMQWRIQDFPEVGAPTSRRGAPTYDFAKISQKPHEIERIWTPGGGASKILLCTSATGIRQLSISSSISISISISDSGSFNIHWNTLWLLKIGPRPIPKCHPSVTMYCNGCCRYGCRWRSVFSHRASAFTLLNQSRMLIYIRAICTISVNCVNCSICSTLWEYFWFYWTFWVVIADGDLNSSLVLHK